MEKKATEMMVDLEGGWLYFRTNAANAKKALKELRQELEYAGIDDSNVEYGNLELRDEDGDTIDEFQANPESNRHQHYDCNHDCLSPKNQKKEKMMAKKATEMMVDLEGGWLYFKVNAKTAKAGFARLREAFKDAGIDVSNIEFGSYELRDEDGDTIDEFQANPESNRHQHYDCNHDCDALYEAYQKGKTDERMRILKAIKGGE